MTSSWIEYIEDGTFDTLGRLEVLKVAWNRILYIPVFFGDATNSLKDVGFQTAFINASMRGINVSQFQNATRINMNDNAISRNLLSSHDNMLMGEFYENFATLKKWRALRLSYNHIKTLPDFDHLSLATISLTGNPLVCNVSLCWIRLWSWVKAPLNAKGTCNSSVLLRLVPIAEADPLAMECYKGDMCTSLSGVLWYLQENFTHSQVPK